MKNWPWIVGGGIALWWLMRGTLGGLRGVQRGIDVSHWQDDIDWSKVAEDGYKFAIIKLSDGRGFIDPEGTDNTRGAKQAGLEVSYYHFAQVDDSRGDAVAEAQHLLSVMRGLPRPTTLRFASGRTAAVWLDLEKTADSVDEEEGLQWLLDWISTVEAAGYPVGIYTKKRWLDREATPGGRGLDQLLTRSDGSQRAFWVARYGQNTGEMPDPSRYSPNVKVPSAWGAYDIWQFTSRGSVPGIDGRVDIDIADFG